MLPFPILVWLEAMDPRYLSDPGSYLRYQDRHLDAER